MMATTQYSALESFLLLQSIQSLDQDASKSVFERISSSLRRSEGLNQNTQLDHDKLDARALEAHYIGLVKGEVKATASQEKEGLVAANNPRKRKLSSPTLDSIEEALQYKHLLPGLVDRVYEHFKDETVRLVRQEESTYERISAQIAASSKSKGPVTSIYPHQSRPAEPAISGRLGQRPSENLHAGIYQSFTSQDAPRHSNPPATNPPKTKDDASDNQGLPETHSRDIQVEKDAQTSANPRAGRNKTTLPQYFPTSQSLHDQTQPAPEKSIKKQPPRNASPASQAVGNAMSKQQSPMVKHRTDGTVPPSRNSSWFSRPPQKSRASFPLQTMSTLQNTDASQTPDHTSEGVKVKKEQSSGRSTPGRKKDGLPTSLGQASKKSPQPASSSSTRWKGIKTGMAAASSPKSPSRPQSRDISPISAREFSLDAEDSSTSVGDESTPVMTSYPNSKMPSIGRPRGRPSRHSQRGRPPSAGSSTAGAQSRGSPMELNEQRERPYSAKGGSDHAGHTESHSPSSNTQTGEEGARKSTRQRRETLRSLDSAPLRSGNKRKRDDEESQATPPSKIDTKQTLQNVGRQRPPQKLGHILATRNFARMTLPYVQSITAHRLASLFAKPLTDREVPGYSGLIFRPQDLKSVRLAVSAGGRALAAIIEELGDDAGNSQHVWVPWSETIAPPKGIVNPDQLEKELMRIFANAVMFNPEVSSGRGLGQSFTAKRERRHVPVALTKTSTDQDGEESESEQDENLTIVEGAIIVDAREVAKDVQESFASWREVERQTEDDDDRPATATTGPPSPSLRREGAPWHFDSHAESSAEDDIKMTMDRDSTLEDGKMGAESPAKASDSVRSNVRSRKQRRRGV